MNNETTPLISDDDVRALELCAKIAELKTAPKLTDTQYRAFLDLMMCSDPWPVVDRDGSDSNVILEGLALDEARARGFESWVVAYHEVKPVSEIPKEST